jgi:hypothetical protein
VADQAESAPAVKLSAQAITYHRHDGTTCAVRWDTLRAVLIETSDDGPFAEDLWWILIDADGHCTIPQEAGTEALLARLQKLPGFDNEAVIAAMSSVENQRFLCWQRQ